MSESFVSTAPRKPTKSTRATKAPKAKAPGLKPAASVLDGSQPAPMKQAEPRVVDAPTPVIIGPMMRKKELIEAVVERSGLKKKDVKPVVETMLAVLGEAIGDNRELNLPPMGRMKIRREKKLANGRMVVAKIRQTTPSERSEPSDATQLPDAPDY